MEDVVLDKDNDKLVKVMNQMFKQDNQLSLSEQSMVKWINEELMSYYFSKDEDEHLQIKNDMITIINETYDRGQYNVHMMFNRGIIIALNQLGIKYKLINIYNDVLQVNGIRRSIGKSIVIHIEVKQKIESELV